MPATELVRLSFYGFTAASIAVAAAAVLYVMEVAWLARATAPAAVPVGANAWRMPATPSTRAGHIATLATRLAVAFVGGAVVLRAVAARRGPYSDMYEFSVAFVFVALLTYVYFEQRYRTRTIGAVALPVVLGMVIYVWSLPPGVREVRGLIPALQSNWILTAHVTSGIVAYSAVTLSFAAAVLYVVVDRWPRAWLPTTELLDDAAFRAVTIGFPAQALLLILGSVWAHEAWGAYWSWDPKETGALFTWLTYGVYLHTRTLRGWRGRRSAVFLTLAFGTVAFTYFGNYWFGGLHAYSGM